MKDAVEYAFNGTNVAYLTQKMEIKNNYILQEMSLFHTQILLEMSNGKLKGELDATTLAILQEVIYQEGNLQ